MFSKEHYQRLREQEAAFAKEFAAHGFEHVKVQGDGNCFYRSVCTLSSPVRALYNDEQHHLQLRRFVADYLLAEAAFFAQFVSDPLGPKHYVAQLRKDGTWADNLEIQIVSELYDCRIEIYTTSRKPIKVFNEKPEAVKMPVRLFYQQQAHYELIWDPRRAHPLESQSFGLVEQASVEAARSRDRGRGEEPVSSDEPTFESRVYFEKLSSGS